MRLVRQPARVNVKVVVILAVVTCLLGGGAVVGHYVRKRIIAGNALAAGKAELEQENWSDACKHLKVYLYKYPDDVEILEAYARAQLAVRPLKPNNVGAAIGAYRRLLRHRPADEMVCGELARLYYGIRDYKEAAYICRQRLKVAPADATAMLWLGRVLAAQHEHSEANEVLNSLVGQHPDQVAGYVLLSALAMQEATASAGDVALEWLNRAVQASPDSAEGWAHRARLRRLTFNDEAGAREDLESADALQGDDPRVILLLASEWTSLGNLDRAQAAIEAAGEIAPEILVDSNIDPAGFASARFMSAGRLALLRGEKENSVKLADQALEQLSDHWRANFLPVAVELYLAGDLVDRARQTVEEFRDAVEQRSDAPISLSQEVALADAAVSDAEGRWYAVIDLLEDRVSADPEQAGAWRLLWRAYEGSGQPRRAVRALETYVTLRPADPKATLALARVYRNRDWGKVLRYAGQAERASPHNLLAKLLRIEAKLRGGEGRLSESQVDASSAELAALREMRPRSVTIRLLQTLIAFGQARLDDAVAELERAMSDTDDPLTAALQLVQLHAQTGRIERAIEVAKSAVEQHPDVAAPATALAELQLAAGQADKAAETLTLAVQQLTGKEKVRVTFALVRHMLSHDERSGGIELLRRLAVDHPDDVRPRLALLELPEVRSEGEESQKLVDELKTIEGKRGLRWKVAQAMLWLHQDDWRRREEAIEELLNDSIQADRGRPAPVLALGRMYELLGKDHRAEELYGEVLNSFPEQVEVVSQLVTMLERQGRFMDAAALLDRMPRVSELSAHRVSTAIGLGEYESAIDQLRQRIAADPNDAGARITLAKLTYSHRKDLGRALELLDEAQALSPGLLTVISTRAAILHAEGRTGEVIALLDAEVSRRKDFAAYMLRAGYYAANGQLDQAEQDYTQLTTFEQSTVEGFAALGGFYQRFGKRDEAVSAWEAGLDVDPDDGRLQRMLMVALATSPQLPARERGRAMLSELLKRFPDDTRLLSVRVDLLLGEGTREATEQAAKTLDRVTRLDPRDANAYLHLIQLMRKDGDLAAARELAVRALGANPHHAELILAQASVEAELNNVRVARQLAESVLEAQPKNIAARNLLSGLALLAGEIESAQVFNDEALELDPGNEIAQEAHARILIARGQQDQAVQDLELYRQTEAGGDSVVALLTLAGLYRTQGDFGTAGKRLEEAAKLAPDDSTVLVERLRWLSAQDRLDEILTELAEVRADQPGDLRTLLLGGGLLVSTGKEGYVHQAKSLFEQVVAFDPNNVDGHAGLALVTYQIGEVEVAEQHYRRILELEPYHRQALNDLAWILAVDLDRVKDALELADKGVARYPNDPHLLDTRGVVFLSLDRLTEARKDLEGCLHMATELPGTRARALLHLAQVCAKENRSMSARARLEEALAIDRQRNVFNERERADIAQLATLLAQ